MNSTTNSNPAIERVLRDLAEGTAYPPLKTLQDNKIIKEEEEETLSITSSTVDQSSSHSLSDKEQPVIFDWDKPLNKVTKEEKPQNLNNSTILVRIVKPALPEDQNAHDAQIPKRKNRRNFYSNKASAKKNQPKVTQAPKNKDLPKSQIPKEEVKEEIIGESENLIQKAVNLDWEKPLKKVFKEDKPQTINSSTILVRIVKPALPEDQNPHDAQIPKRKDRKNFYNKNFKDSTKKNQPKTQALKNQNIPKPLVQPKPIEEVKEEIIEEAKNVTQSAVSSDWDKPVKKIFKEDKPQTINSSTVVVRVLKPVLPEDQNPHDAQIPKRKDRKNFYKNFKDSTKKNQPKTQAPKKNLPKPQIQPKSEPIEEVKEEIIEEPKDVTQNTVSSDWDNPLKKIPKEDKSLQTLNSSTVVVRIVKPALPDDQNAHDAQIPKRKDRKNFYNNKNNSNTKKNQLKTQTPKKDLPKSEPKEEVKEKIIEEPPRNLSD